MRQSGQLEDPPLPALGDLLVLADFLEENEEVLKGFDLKQTHDAALAVKGSDIGRVVQDLRVGVTSLLELTGT